MLLYASEDNAVVGLKQVFILFNLRFRFCVHVLNITDTYMKIGMCAVKYHYFQHFTVKSLSVYMCVFKQEKKMMPRALKCVCFLDLAIFILLYCV